MDLEDPTFQMKKELLCKARSAGILKDSTRQSQRTRPEARFLHPANAVSLSRRDTHTQIYWADPLVPKNECGSITF